jgi:ribosomal protein L40E
MCCKFRPSSQYLAAARLCGVIIEVGTDIYKYSMRVLSPIMFTIGFCLILSIAILFFFVFFPEFFQDSILLYFANAVIGLYLYVNVAFHHIACCITPPGSPPYCPDPGRILGEKVSIVNGRKIYQVSYQLNVAPYVSYKYCHSCKSVKPPRAHHCRQVSYTSNLLLLFFFLLTFAI